ncbi:hypothetical protein Tco_1136842 [Tanacetum coccineum]
MQSILKERASIKRPFVDLNRLLVAGISASMRKSHSLDFIEAKMSPVYMSKSKRIIGLSQDTYLDKILKRFKMENSKKGNLPLHHGIKIRLIMYAMTCTRPYVSFALSMDLSLWWEEELRVTGYCDASWKTDKDDSPCEASKKAIWMKNFIGDLRVVPIVQDPIKIFYDNESVVALTKEPKDHEKLKNIERKYHFVRSKVEEGHVIVKHIRSEDNPADPFTKELAKSRHDEHARSIGLKDNIKF